MRHIHEMRAYGKSGNEDAIEVVGYIILDEDTDVFVTNIYEDDRLPCCGSNWSLHQTYIIPKDDVTSNKYFCGDWKEDGIV